MAVELDIVRLKVARAEKHFEDFQAEVGAGVEQAVRIKGAIVTAGGKTPFNSGKQPLQGGSYTMQLERPNEPHGIELEQPEPYIVFTDTDCICDSRSAFPLFRHMAAAVKDVLARFDRFF